MPITDFIESTKKSIIDIEKNVQEIGARLKPPTTSVVIFGATIDLTSDQVTAVEDDIINSINERVSNIIAIAQSIQPAQEIAKPDPGPVDPGIPGGLVQPGN